MPLSPQEQLERVELERDTYFKNWQCVRRLWEEERKACVAAEERLEHAAKAALETLKAEIEALPRWAMVSRSGECPELDHSPRGAFLSLGDVLRLLADHVGP